MAVYKNFLETGREGGNTEGAKGVDRVKRTILLLLMTGAGLAGRGNDAQAQSFFTQDGKGIHSSSNPSRLQLLPILSHGFHFGKVKGGLPGGTVGVQRAELEARYFPGQGGAFLALSGGVTQQGTGYDPNNPFSNADDLYKRGYESQGGSLEFGAGFRALAIPQSGTPRIINPYLKAGIEQGIIRISGDNNPELLNSQFGSNTRSNDYRNAYGNIGVQISKQVGPANFSAGVGTRAFLTNGSNNPQGHGVAKNNTTLPDAKTNSFAFQPYVSVGIKLNIGGGPKQKGRTTVSIDNAWRTSNDETRITQKAVDSLTTENKKLTRELEEIRKSTDKAQEILMSDPRFAASQQAYASHHAIYMGLKSLDSTKTLEELKNQGTISQSIYDQYQTHKQDIIKAMETIIKQLEEEEKKSPNLQAKGEIKKLITALTTLVESLKNMN